jgi:hypothetical protein
MISTRPLGNFNERGNSNGKESSEGQQKVEAGKEGSAAGVESEAPLNRSGAASRGLAALVSNLNAGPSMCGTNQVSKAPQGGNFNKRGN